MKTDLFITQHNREKLIRTARIAEESSHWPVCAPPYSIILPTAQRHLELSSLLDSDRIINEILQAENPVVTHQRVTHQRVTLSLTYQ